MYKNLLFFIVIGAIALASCGEEETGPALADAIIGSWAQVSFSTDCEADSLDNTVEFVCDADNCQIIVLGDSTFTSIFRVNGAEVVLNEFYILTDDQLEICDGLEFNSECEQPVTVSVSNDRLSLSVPSEDGVNCFDIREYIRLSTAPADSVD